MEVWAKSIRLFIVTLVICALGISIYVILSQPPYKTIEIYKHSLNLYEQEDYSKAYGGFASIIFTSSLKPLAIYHQGVCADKVGDVNAAIKQYNRFLRFFPSHRLAMKVKYNLAQDLVEKDPKRAQKYFENIIKSKPESDYAIASEYYIGLLTLKKYKNEKIFPLSVKTEIENHFRHYLKKAPSGRLALSVIANWTELDKDISKDDYLIMANSYYLFDDYKKASEFASKAEMKNAWALEVKNAVSAGNKARAIYLTEWGLAGNADYVEKEDVYAAIDAYMTLVPSKYQAANKLMGLAKSRGKDYLLSIKCSNSPKEEKLDCYKNFYLWFPTSDFIDEAQAQIFLNSIWTNDLAGAQRIGVAFLNKYKDSPFVPMVLYYMGYLSERSKSYRDYVSYYKSVITQFPDSYYAYRAYVRLNHLKSAIIYPSINGDMPMEFPYPKRHVILDKLMELGDFEVLEEYVANDEFVKSWVAYKRGNPKQGMLIARDAMDKLKPKPPKTDLRWRLVYPLTYYDKVSSAAYKAGTVAPLIQSIVREESYFYPDATSSVGAKGLMQLMPSTASEVASKYSIHGYSLNNPEQNLQLGSRYYAFLRNTLGGNDVSAIAAYNGGIGAVNNWKSSLNYPDTDSFVEQIPYPETQNYVKKVFRTYWNYIRIYGKELELH